MTRIATRELRNDTAGVLRRVQAGEEVVITVKGVPVAQIIPLSSKRRRPIPGAEMLRRMDGGQADPGLRDDLIRLAGETTDDLGPIR